MIDRLNILLVEDSSGDSRLIKELLAESKTVAFDLKRVERLTMALDLLVMRPFDVVLLDLALPDSFGLESLGLQATQAGAQDYLVKGQVSSQLLIRSIRYSIERKRFERRLEYLATHDDLTGLPNRQLFNYTLGLALERARREQHDSETSSKVAVMLLDLDNFKLVNDTFGHIQGDKLLCAAAGRLKSCMRKSDTFARMGGDEFTLVVEHLSTPLDSVATAQKVLAALSEPFDLDGTILKTTASIGISIYPNDGTNPESLLQYADIAMYRAKQIRNHYQFYSSLEMI